VSYFRWDGEDLILDCRLQPKASKDEFAGLHGERLKIRLTAPPVDGKANAHLLAFLAKAFGVAKSQVSLESGELNRQTPAHSRPTEPAADSRPAARMTTIQPPQPTIRRDCRSGQLTAALQLA